MRTAWLSMAVGLGVLAGCGSEDAPRTDREQIEAAVTDYFDAAARGDGDEACRHLTTAAQRDFANRADADSCQKGIAKTGDALSDDARGRMHDARVTDVIIRGKMGLVTIEGLDGNVAVEKGDGRWRITVVGAGGTPGKRTASDCIAGAMEQFDAGNTDPFWQREGRKDFRSFMTATCRQAEAQGLLSGPGHQAAFNRIGGRVILRMVRRGQIRQPR